VMRTAEMWSRTVRWLHLFIF